MKNGLDGRFSEKPDIVVPVCNMLEPLLGKELKVVRVHARVSHFQDVSLSVTWMSKTSLPASR